MTKETELEFRQDWARRGAGAPPLGWALREEGALPWVRCHALPGAQRYATTRDEHAIVLARANRLGDRLLGAGTPCWIVDLQAEGSDEARAAEMEWHDSDDPDAPVLRFHVHVAAWQAGAFDSRLLAIAEGRARSLWMARSTGAILAPYDGGFDLFPPGERDREVLRSEFAAWLSSRPDGL